MKKRIVALLAGAILMVGMATVAYALPSSLSYNFYYPTTSLNWGNMVLTATDADTIQVDYAATTSPTIPYGATVTAFGFNFTTIPDNTSNNATTPTWYELDKPKNLPSPANGPNMNFTYGDGNDIAGNYNMSNPGIGPGGSDTFYLNFLGLDPQFTAMTNAQFANFVDDVAIRLQSLPENINGGSLLLVGSLVNPVPEPGTMMLLGIGMLGMAVYGKRRINRA